MGDIQSVSYGEEDKVNPVEEPSDYEGVARILKKAADDKSAVVPRGGGTMMGLGAPVRRTAVVLSLKQIDRILDHQPANLTVRTEAGITLGDLNRTLSQQGQFLPLDPPFPDRATIGGILSTNASGSLRVRYGSSRDQLLGLRVVLADGRIIHGGGDVVKNVAGYDLPKLFIGSLGTLGIIVEATFKTAPLPPITASIVASFDDLQSASGLALRILRSSMLPHGIRLMNRTAASLLGLGDRFACAIRFGGIAGSVEQQLDEVTAMATHDASSSVSTLDNDAGLWAHMRDLVYEKATVVKIGIPPSKIVRVAGQAQELATLSGLGLTFVADAVGVIYASLEGNPDQISGTVKSMRDSAISVGGHLIILRASADVLEQVDVWGPIPSGLGIMKQLKQQLDPDGILNPGRYVGGI